MMSSSGAFPQLHICYNLSVTVPSSVLGLGACGSRCSSSASYIINPLYISQSSNGTFNLICLYFHTEAGYFESAHCEAGLCRENMGGLL